MPLTAVSTPHAATVRHFGHMNTGVPDITAGFDVTFARTTERGGPVTAPDRTLPAQMRRLARVQLRLWGLAELIETVDVLVSELVTNGVRHGHGTALATRLWRTRGHVWISVTGGPGARHGAGRTRVAGPGDEGGRGLLLVGALSDGWGVSADGACTWCVLVVPTGR
ncbi:ATP-binding protein [Streptomyces sp. CAU 1734]|uniref:ATP-binding protein n=1 Tax=Streptomyces sp. CAU 1734 TaxID=3140360 RepID=UPI003260E959